MAKNYYRALISIPIFADTDDQALAQANEHAHRFGRTQKDRRKSPDQGRSGTGAGDREDR